jgi:hypothetical protein
MNETRWLGMRLRATFRQLLGLISDKGSRNHNGIDLLFLLLPFLARLDNLTILIEQLMDEIMLNANINVSNAAIPHISNGVVPFIPVRLVTKWHLDMHHEHVMDVSMMMGFVAILILKESTMETSRESVEKHVTGSCFLFKKFSMPHFLIYLSLPSSIMSSLAFSKTFEFLPQHSIVKSSITPFFDKFYPPPILTKHHTWYLNNADLFISIHNTLYGIHQRQLVESILFREVLEII